MTDSFRLLSRSLRRKSSMFEVYFVYRGELVVVEGGRYKQLSRELL